MNDTDILSRLRRFLLVFPVLLFGGAVTELYLVNHFKQTLQIIPFGLAALGTVAALAALVRPRRATLRLLQASMTLVILGTLLGIFLHVKGNYDFQREIDPEAPAADLWRGAIRGDNPLLAPGVLSVAAILALAATYRHPTLGRGE